MAHYMFLLFDDELVRRPDTREVGVRDFEDETGLVLPEGPYETVAGYIAQQLGHVPAVGEAARFDGHTFTVKSSMGTGSLASRSPPCAPRGHRTTMSRPERTTQRESRRARHRPVSSPPPATRVRDPAALRPYDGALLRRTHGRCEGSGLGSPYDGVTMPVGI